MNDDMGWEPINCLEEEDDLVHLWYNAFQRPEDPAFLNFPESSQGNNSLDSLVEEVVPHKPLYTGHDAY